MYLFIYLFESILLFVPHIQLKAVVHPFSRSHDHSAVSQRKVVAPHADTMKDGEHVQCEASVLDELRLKLCFVDNC